MPVGFLLESVFIGWIVLDAGILCRLASSASGRSSEWFLSV